MTTADWPSGEPVTQSQGFPEVFHSIGRRSWSSPSPVGPGDLQGDGSDAVPAAPCGESRFFGE